jgi:predicted DsbA family dithiol-disulfide isomerase
MPGTETQPVETMLAQRYGRGATQVAQMHAQVTQIAAQVGLAYKLAGTLTGDTLHAHRVGANGVPFFVIADKVAVSGPQAPEKFLAALNMA